MCAWLPQHSAKIVGPAPLRAVNEREREGGREMFVSARVYMCDTRMCASLREYTYVRVCAWVCWRLA